MRPFRRSLLLAVELLADRHERRMVGGRAVLLVGRIEDTLATGFGEHFARMPVCFPILDRFAHFRE